MSVIRTTSRRSEDLIQGEHNIGLISIDRFSIITITSQQSMNFADCVQFVIVFITGSVDHHPGYPVNPYPRKALISRCICSGLEGL